MSAIASVARYTATLAVFSLHNRRARSSAWLAPNSSPISQTARQFAKSLVSSSRHIIVARVSVKSLLQARPASHANVIAQGLRSPVQNIVLTRTGSTSGSGSPEPRSDSSMPYEHAYFVRLATKADLSNRSAAVALRDVASLMTAVGQTRPSEDGLVRCLPFFAAMRWSADEAAFLQHLPKKTPIGAKMGRGAVTSSTLIIVLAPAFRF